MNEKVKDILVGISGVALGIFASVGFVHILEHTDKEYGDKAQIQERQEYEAGNITKEEHNAYCVELERKNNVNKGLNIAAYVVAPLFALCGAELLLTLSSGCSPVEHQYDN